jgi:16S rRNA (cytosine967-C5)-methyltransferase
VARSVLRARLWGGSGRGRGALAQRATLDLRVNTLVADRGKAAAALADLGVMPTAWSPVGLRIATAPDAKSPAVQSEPAFLKGMIEVQDEGSQLAALLSAAKAGEQVIDLCAGAGGKSLALAAMMEKRGQVYATDLDKRRLAPIYARLERAGAHTCRSAARKGGTTTALIRSPICTAGLISC